MGSGRSPGHPLPPPRDQEDANTAAAADPVAEARGRTASLGAAVALTVLLLVLAGAPATAQPRPPATPGGGDFCRRLAEVIAAAPDGFRAIPQRPPPPPASPGAWMIPLVTLPGAVESKVSRTQGAPTYTAVFASGPSARGGAGTAQREYAALKQRVTGCLSGTRPATTANATRFQVRGARVEVVLDVPPGMVGTASTYVMVVGGLPRR
jgi:hypothetical protein